MHSCRAWLCFAICCIALAVAPLARAQKTCTVTPANAPVGPAEQAYQQGDYAKSYELYRAAYEAKPSDELLEGAVRAAVAAHKYDEAKKLVAEHPSGSAWYLMAKARVELRDGRIDDARRDAFTAAKADLCNARAHFFAARLLRMDSMYAAGKRQIDIAHQLDQSNPGLNDEWLSFQPLAVRRDVFKKMAEDKSLSERDQKEAAERAQYIQDRMDGKGHNCHLVSTSPSMTTSMVPIMKDGNSIAAWGLSVAVNGHSTPVEIDTGASGLLLNRVAAEKSGLKPLGDSDIYWGIGGKSKGSYAYADSIKIGDMEFADCVVRIEDHQAIQRYGPQGLIGTDVFADSMVTLDFPLRKFSISPLPGLKAETPAEAATSGDSRFISYAQDRYAGPEVKDFVPFFRDGHFMILPVLLNNKPETLVVDTGSSATIFNLKYANEFTKPHKDMSYYKKLPDGTQKLLYTTGEVKLQLQNGMGQILNGALADELYFGEIESGGLLGVPFLYNLVVSIDYRDGLVRFNFDRQHGANAW